MPDRLEKKTGRGVARRAHHRISDGNELCISSGDTRARSCFGVFVGRLQVRLEGANIYPRTDPCGPRGPSWAGSSASDRRPRCCRCAAPIRRGVLHARPVLLDGHPNTNRRSPSARAAERDRTVDVGFGRLRVRREPSCWPESSTRRGRGGNFIRGLVVAVDIEIEALLVRPPSGWTW